MHAISSKRVIFEIMHPDYKITWNIWNLWSTQSFTVIHYSIDPNWMCEHNKIKASQIWVPQYWGFLELFRSPALYPLLLLFAGVLWKTSNIGWLVCQINCNIYINKLLVVLCFRKIKNHCLNKNSVLSKKFWHLTEKGLNKIALFLCTVILKLCVSSTNTAHMLKNLHYAVLDQGSKKFSKS